MNFPYNIDLLNTYIFYIIFMMEDVLKQCLRKEIMVTCREEKKTMILIFASLSLTLDKLGFWEYLARFSLDKFIKGPSGLVNIEAWKNNETKCHAKCFRLSSQSI